METKQRPMIGLGVIVHDGNGKILLARRPLSKAVGAGTWQLPGGHLEMYEELEDGAIREVAEECGTDIQIERPVFFAFTNNPWPEANKHYITMFYVAKRVSGEAQISGGHGPWEWFDVGELPEPLFEGSGIFTPENIDRIGALAVSTV